MFGDDDFASLVHHLVHELKALGFDYGLDSFESVSRLISGMTDVCIEGRSSPLRQPHGAYYR